MDLWSNDHSTANSLTIYYTIHNSLPAVPRKMWLVEWCFGQTLIFKSVKLLQQSCLPLSHVSKKKGRVSLLFVKTLQRLFGQNLELSFAAANVTCATQVLKL